MVVVMACLGLATGCSSPTSGGGGTPAGPAPVAVTGVTPTKTVTYLLDSGTEQLYAVVAPANATNQAVSWSSSDPTVASVSSTGLVTGKASGSTSVKVTTADGQKVSSLTVNVASTPTSVTSVSLSATPTTLLAGDTQLLTATLDPVYATNQNLTWLSSDPTVATVGPGGLVKAVTPGTTTITVTTVDGNKSATYPITVSGLILNEVANAYYRDYAVGIEVYNPTPYSINLSTYQLRTNSALNDETVTNPNYAQSGVRTFSLPSVSIPAGGYAVLRGKISSFLESGGLTVLIDDGASPYPHYPWYFSSGTSGTGFVELLQGGATADFVRWGSDTTAPTTAGAFSGANLAAFGSDPASIGYSYSRDVTSTNTHAAADWTLRAWNTLGGPNDVTTDTASDNDGIPDSAKAPSGTFAGLPLNAWGAQSGHRDIFIHLAYMVKGSVGATDPGMIPQKAALGKVVAAFLAQNISIHFDVGDLFSSTAGDTANYNLDGTSHAVPYSGSASLGKQAGYANVYQYKNAYMAAAKSRVFFFMLFGDSQLSPAASGSSGIANLPGNTSLITLGHWGLTTSPQANLNELVNFQAATMMHEFGHNLGLHHGGDEDDNYKPNYYSIMNYLYQLAGLPTVGADDDTRYYHQLYSTNYSVANWASHPHATKATASSWTDGPTSSSFLMSYSNGGGSSIDESGAVESAGIGRSGLAIDFNDDGDTLDATGFDIRYYLDPNLTTPPTRRVLHDFNDWTAISSVFQRTFGGYNLGATQPGTGTTAKTLAPGSVAPTDFRVLFNSPLPPLSGVCAPDPRLPVVRAKS